MAQSTDSNLRGAPAVWPTHTAELPTQWTSLIDEIHLINNAKKNLDIETSEKTMKSETKIPILEGPQRVRKLKTEES